MSKALKRWLCKRGWHSPTFGITKEFHGQRSDYHIAICCWCGAETKWKKKYITKDK